MKQLRLLTEITEVEIEAASKGMSKGKAAGLSGLTSELLQAAGKVGKESEETFLMTYWM